MRRLISSGLVILKSACVDNSAAIHRCRRLLRMALFAAGSSANRSPTPAPTTHANLLRGEYGRFAPNNDLLYYDLDIRVDPEKKFVRGVKRSVPQAKVI